MKQSFNKLRRESKILRKNVKTWLHRKRSSKLPIGSKTCRSCLSSISCSRTNTSASSSTFWQQKNRRWRNNSPKWTTTSRKRKMRKILKYRCFRSGSARSMIVTRSLRESLTMLMIWHASTWLISLSRATGLISSLQISLTALPDLLWPWWTAWASRKNRLLIGPKCSLLENLPASTHIARKKSWSKMKKRD